jgi:hypothetical protein
MQGICFRMRLEMVYFLYIYILLLINYIICLTAAMDGVSLQEKLLLTSTFVDAKTKKLS